MSDYVCNFQSAPHSSTSAPHETKGSKLSQGREFGLVTILKMMTRQHCRHLLVILHPETVVICSGHSVIREGKKIR